MTSLSEELFHVYARQGRPAPQRNRHLPIQSTPDNRKWSPLLKMTVSFAIFFAVLIGGCSVLWGLG